jgi:hypothetical protein
MNAPDLGTGVDITKTGDELIAIERDEQVMKHGHTIASDLKKNNNGELLSAALSIIGGAELIYPRTWDIGIFNRSSTKTRQQRLVIAGALIAAEIDRLNLLAQVQATFGVDENEN